MVYLSKVYSWLILTFGGANYSFKLISGGILFNPLVGLGTFKQNPNGIKIL